MHKYIWVLLLFLIWFLALPAMQVTAITTLVPELGLGVDYNDNILFNDAERISDTIYRVSPGIALKSRSDVLDAGISAKARANYYDTYTEFDGIDQYYLGRLVYSFNPKFQSSVEAEYSIDTQVDRDLDTTGLLLTAATRDRLRGFVKGAYAPTEMTSTVFGYTYLQDEFDEPRLSDSRIHSLSLTINQDLSRIFPKTQGSLIFSYGDYTYERLLEEVQSSTIGSIRTTYDETTLVDNFGLSAGVLYDWTEIFDIYVNLGGRYTEISYDQKVTQTVSIPPNPDQVEFVTSTESNSAWAGTGEMRFSYQGEKDRISLGLSNDLQPASGSNSPSVRTDFFLLLSRQATERLRGFVDTRYFINNTGINPFDIQTWEEQTFSINPGVHFQFHRHLFLKLSYRYTAILREASNNDSHRNLVSAEIVGRYPLFE